MLSGGLHFHGRGSGSYAQNAWTGEAKPLKVPGASSRAGLSPALIKTEAVTFSLLFFLL